MKYAVFYSLTSNTGFVREINQDNYILAGRYLRSYQSPPAYPLSGVLKPGEKALLGVFDGMGGGTHGEVASFLAAKTAAESKPERYGCRELEQLCMEQNRAICTWAKEEKINVTGSTAVMLGFGEEEINLCNIGDSKAFLLRDGELRQISVDHLCKVPPGKKAPLSQCLGIPEDDMLIEPYTASLPFREGDVFLLCSDGLTDMVSPPEIAELLSALPADKAAEALKDAALNSGGKDNVTILVCRIGTDAPKLSQSVTVGRKAPIPKNDPTVSGTSAKRETAPAPEVSGGKKAKYGKTALTIGLAVLVLILAAAFLLGGKKAPAAAPEAPENPVASETVDDLPSEPADQSEQDGGVSEP